MQTAPSDSDEILMSRVGKLLYGGCSGLAELDGYQTEYLVVDQKTGIRCV